MTDSQWNLIKPHLPPPAKTGRPRNNDRTTIDAIMFVLITGSGGLIYLYSLVPNHQHIEDFNIFNKKEFVKTF